MNAAPSLWPAHGEQSCSTYFPGHTPAPLTADGLRQALVQRRLDTRYQAIVQLATGSPVGFEVLARLRDPVRGMVPPDEFIPLAGRSGLLGALTNAVIEIMFQEAQSGVLEGIERYLAVNVPLHLVLSDRAREALDEARAMTTVPASDLLIELTETEPVTDFAQLARSMRAWDRLGYRVALDDIDPDRPDYERLLAMPFATVKFDLALVQRAPAESAARTFIESTCRRAHAMGMTTIAEGVEDQTCWDLMHALGVGHVQGFFVSLPLPARAVPAWHAAWQCPPRPRL